jgi:hypothetical protein
MMPQIPDDSLGALGIQLDQINTDLREGGPAVDYSFIYALVEGELPESDRVRIEENVCTWKNWYQAYWEVYRLRRNDIADSQKNDDQNSTDRSSVPIPPKIAADLKARVLAEVNRLNLNCDGLSVREQETTEVSPAVRSLSSGSPQIRTWRHHAVGAAALVLLAASLVWLVILPSRSESVLLVDNGRKVFLGDDGVVGGLPDVDEGLRANIRNALVKGEVAIDHESPMLVGMRGGHTPRSKSSLISPFHTVCLTDRPSFRWRAPAGAQGFVVRIYDKDLKVIAESPPLESPSWSAFAPLKRGETYSWDVTAQVRGEPFVSPAEGQARPRFRILDARSLNEIEDIRRKASGSHLAMAIEYADQGLLDESEAELEELRRENPNSTLVRSLLEGIRGLRE